MKIRILMITASIALIFLVIPQPSWAQKDGEAQAVILAGRDRFTLKFSNESSEKQGCGFTVTNTLFQNQEESFGLTVSHLHSTKFFASTAPETGWLLITPSRISFTVHKGDRSHAFDLREQS